MQAADHGHTVAGAMSGQILLRGGRALLVLTCVAACLPSTSAVQAAATSGTLTVRVAQLPSGRGGGVAVTGARRTWRIARTTTLHVPPGSYRILASPVRGRHGVRYFPVLASQRVLVRSARGTGVVADYATIVPPSTHTPAASAIRTISGKAGGTQVIAFGRAAAAHYRTGDVIAAGRSRRAPDGFLVRITRVLKRTPRTVSFRVTPATLAQALPRTVIDALVPAARPGTAINLACGATATATVSADLAMGLRMHLETGGRNPHLTAASFDLSASAKTGVALTTAGDGTCNATRSTATSPQAITVHAGPVPIVLVPRLTTRVALAGGYGAGIVATTLQTITGTLRLGYDGKTWRRSSGLARMTSHRLDDSELGADGARGRFSTTITPTASILLDGLAGPHLISTTSRRSRSRRRPASISRTRPAPPTASSRPSNRSPDRQVAGRRDNLRQPANRSTTGRSPVQPGDTGEPARRRSSPANGITCALLQSGRLYCWGLAASATAALSRPCRCS